MCKGLQVKRSICEVMDHYLNGGPSLAWVYYQRVVLVPGVRPTKMAFTVFGTFFDEISQRILGRMTFRPKGIDLDKEGKARTRGAYCSAVFTAPIPEHPIYEAPRLLDVDEETFRHAIDTQLILLEDYYERF